MPVLAADATDADARAAAADADRRAQAAERQFLALAAALFAFEAETMRRALARARTPAAVVAVLGALRRSYQAPDGVFYQAWRDRATPVIEGVVRDAARDLARQQGRPLPPTLTPAARRLVEARAAALAADVCATTVQPIAAAERVLAAELRAPAPRPGTTGTTTGASGAASGSTVALDLRTAPSPAQRVAPPLPPGAPPPGARPGLAGRNPDDIWAQREATLEPLVGKAAAREIIQTVRASREAGQSIATIAKRLTADVHATDVTRTRATRIARTETIGALAGGEYAEAVASGVVTVKKWLTNLDARVRDSHRACEAQGWIAIDTPFTNGLQYVGQRPAPPSEVINCRCTIAYADQPI